MSIHIDEVKPGDIYNGKVITYKGYDGRIVHLQFNDGSNSRLLVVRDESQFNQVANGKVKL